MWYGSSLNHWPDYLRTCCLRVRAERRFRCGTGTWRYSSALLRKRVRSACWSGAASPLYDLVFVAASALGIVVFLACNVDHDMVGLTLFDHRPFFIHSDLLAILKAVFTEPGLAVRIVEVLL